MTQYTSHRTRSGSEWSINDAGAERDIEIEYETWISQGAMGTSRCSVFLSRADLVAMLKAIDDR